MARQFESIGDSRIVYDPSLINHSSLVGVDERLFDPGAWPGASTRPENPGGRGQTFFIDAGQDQWVLRHYHRGGMIGRLIDDTYLWTGDSRSRPFLEWLLLEKLVAMNLPVPQPVAARLVRRGPFYSADLVTVCIPDVVPFSARFASGDVSPALWRAIGELVARFHSHAVSHADLNAHNIQVNDRDELFLLDFDRGRIMTGRGAWAESNLRRLERSLRKISAEGGSELSAEHWNTLLTAYKQALVQAV